MVVVVGNGWTLFAFPNQRQLTITFQINFSFPNQRQLTITLQILTSVTIPIIDICNGKKLRLLQPYLVISFACLFCM